MNTLLIRGGRVISPAGRIDAEIDILVKDGIIRRMEPRVAMQDSAAGADEVIDAAGLIVCPGFVDIHVHLREPGGEASETLETGLSAAVAGGFTAVCPMPNTRPVNDNPGLTRAAIEKAQRLEIARVYPIAAATIGSAGADLTDFAALKTAGAVAFSDDGKPLATARLMREALLQARELGMPIIDHCEDLSLSAGGAMNAGATAAQLGLKGVTNAAEEACIARDIDLAAQTGAHVHIAHISTAAGVDMVRLARKRGIHVTCEATPHHFALIDEAVAIYGTNAKMNPPLRSARDREAIIEGLVDGTIDAIATDHAPHSPKLKAQPLSSAPFGVTGLETAFSLAIMQLVEPGHISVAKLIELLSSNPARILNLPVGRLHVGSPADVTLFDPAREWTYHAAEGKSKSRNSPFDGWNLKGVVIATIVGGKVVHHRDRIV